MNSDARLLSVAERLADTCPADLGREIAITGSVGAGLADEHSDLELLFLVEEVPTPARVGAWLEQAGATDVLAGESDGIWAWCRVDGVELEPFWAAENEVRARIDRIARGEVIEHGALALAHVVQHARLLRTRGVLGELVARVAGYPEHLRTKLIEDAVSGWEIPSPRLGAALRGDRFPMEGFLLHDAERVLRIVFALNRRWELPSRWKWLTTYVPTLTIVPERLAERVVAPLVETDVLAALESMLELIRDTLELVPPELDVTAARRGTERRLAVVREHASVSPAV